MERNLMVAGFGGQGVMTLGKFLAEATCDSTDKNVTFFPSYGAEQRGGTANCYVVISNEKIGAPLGDVMDDLIVMNGPSLNKFLYKLKEGGSGLREADRLVRQRVGLQQHGHPYAEAHV